MDSGGYSILCVDAIDAYTIDGDVEKYDSIQYIISDIKVIYRLA